MSKLVEERTRKQLLEIAAMPGNDSCADCKARAPRWASHNLGIFICVRCATVHRKIGTHVTKVKSLTLDSWSKDQVEVMRQNGNLKSNTFFNPNESRNPPPTNLEESERDGELEKYIRSKYEHRRFVDRTPRQQPQPQSQNAFPPPPRAQSTPLTTHQRPAASVQRPPSAHPTPAPVQPVFGNSSTLQYRPSTITAPPPQARPALAPAPAAPAKPAGGVWDDILAIQSGPAAATASNPYANATQANATFAQLSQPGAPAFIPQPQAQTSAFSLNPSQFAQTQPTGAFANMGAVSAQPGLSPQPGLSGISQPIRSFTMPAGMPSTSLSPFPPQQVAPSPGGNPFFNMQQQAQQQFTPSPLSSPPIGGFTQQPQSFAQQAFPQQQQQQPFAQQAFQQPQQQAFQQPQQPAFQASPSFFQQAQQHPQQQRSPFGQPQQQSPFGQPQQQSVLGQPQQQQQPAFAQQQQPAFDQQQQQQPAFGQSQQQPAFNLQNFMPQAQQQQQQMPAQTNPFSQGYPQAGQQQPFAGGAFGQQQMYSQPQPGWPSS
ncbi:ArfGap-domain-containing protein [Auricularia subglabra TFB-10046 SS5]|nr:ArfGap-domain-containing protein [Auricularia subglabra TFB-10046 SS5]